MSAFTDGFNDGIEWGIFLTQIRTSKHLPDAPRIVLLALAEAAAEKPEMTCEQIRNLIMTEWTNYHCHGGLTNGMVCAECGIQNAGEEG
jgi:hypothetical protein